MQVGSGEKMEMMIIDIKIARKPVGYKVYYTKVL
jgi:hypothetical protein